MDRIQFGVASLAALLTLTGCGSRGWSAEVLDSSGRPVPHATVTLAPVPPGGLQELEAELRTGRPSAAWHFTTDDNGRASLHGLPHGYFGVTGYTEPYVYTLGSRPTGGEKNRVAVSDQGPAAYAGGQTNDILPHVVEVPQHTLYRFVKGPWLAVLVDTPTFHGYAAQIQLNRTYGRFTIRLEDSAPPEVRVSLRSGS